MVKLKLHGFHQAKITYVLLQRKRHSKAVVHRCSSSRSQMFFKIGVLKRFVILTGKYLCWSLFLINFVKETPTQVCSCEYWKIFKNSFFVEHIRWLLLQALNNKNIPKNLANLTRMYRYRSPFLSSRRPITSNFVKIESPVQVLLL